MLGMDRGTFTLLRKRALVSDTVSHATLPGRGGWLVMVALGGTAQMVSGPAAGRRRRRPGGDRGGAPKFNGQQCMLL